MDNSEFTNAQIVSMTLNGESNELTVSVATGPHGAHLSYRFTLNRYETLKLIAFALQSPNPVGESYLKDIAFNDLMESFKSAHDELQAERGFNQKLKADVQAAYRNLSDAMAKWMK